jgi:hypothetical protein
MELSAWWVLGAFFVGGYAGGLLVALMAIVSSDGGDAVHPNGGLTSEPSRPARLSA